MTDYSVITKYKFYLQFKRWCLIYVFFHVYKRKLRKLLNTFCTWGKFVIMGWFLCWILTPIIGYQRSIKPRVCTYVFLLSRALGSGNRSPYRPLKMRARSWASSKCWIWSSPTGTWVVLRDEPRRRHELLKQRYTPRQHCKMWSQIGHTWSYCWSSLQRRFTFATVTREEVTH